MLVDEVNIMIRAGKGGPGCVSFHAKMGAGPDGGDGGRGGNVYVEVVSDIYSLNRFVSQNFITHRVTRSDAMKSQAIIRGLNGEPGGKNDRSGPAGKDLIIYMPVGTVLLDESSKEEIELEKVGEIKLLARGGLGGHGNAFFKSSSNTTPRYAQPGLGGEEKRFKVKLKLIADFGLIGLPNAGKSSLLNEITNAQAKVGDYPFTTLEPNLGVFKGRVIADIPGLIEGASLGKGLGIKFLKHIEKVKLLLHCISADSEDIAKDYKVVIKELENYNPELIEKEQIILLTKSDLVTKEDLDKKIKLLKKLKKEVIPISIHDWDSLQNLLRQL